MKISKSRKRKKTYFWNSITVFVFALSTKGQFPDEQVTLVFGESLFDGQYAAAAYCSKRFRVAKRSDDIAKYGQHNSQHSRKIIKYEEEEKEKV